MGRKVVFWALLLAVPTTGPAWAQVFDTTADTTRYLGDPTFLPSAGRLSGETAYAYQDFSEDRHLAGTILSWPHYAARDNVIGQSFAYGLTDRLSVNAVISYQEHRIKDDYGGYAVYDFYSHGFNNPGFGVTFRALEQTGPEEAGTAMPVNVDLALSYAPNVFTAKLPTSSMAGTVASGGPSGNLSLAVSRELKSLTLQAYGSLTQLGERNIRILADNSSTTMGSQLIAALGLRSQFRPMDRLFVNAAASVSRANRLAVSNAAERVSYTGSFKPTVSGTVEPGWHLIPNRLTVSAQYSRIAIGDEAMTNRFSSLGSWQNSVENVYTLRLRYVF